MTDGDQDADGDEADGDEADVDEADVAADGDPHEPARSGRSDWWDLAAAVILSLATVASAWSSYQAARWSGETTRANRAANAARVDATKQSDLASRQVAVDVTTFAIWLEATVRNDAALAEAIADRFRPELRTAFDAWRATGDGPLAAGSPFDLDAYQLRANDEGDRLLALAETRADDADQANQNGDNFVLTAVLYASVLFFAGIASKLATTRAQHFAVALSGSMFVLATAVMATLPVNMAF